MSIVFYCIEKVTIKNSDGLSSDTIDMLSREIDRIQAHENDEFFSCKIMLNTGNTWVEQSLNQFTRENLYAAIQENERLEFYYNGEYTWTADRVDWEDPGFALGEFFNSCDEDVFQNVSFAFYSYADCSDSYGELTQYGLREDGTVFKGKAEYEKVDEIPDAEWINNMITVSILGEDLPDVCDPEKVNNAVERLNKTEYCPQKRLDDFHNRDAEAFINQPRLETEAQRKEFFAALEEARIATKGRLIFDQPEFVDASTMNVRMLMLDMNEDTGAIQYYVTKDI